jgi:PQQ-dependent dehydrogenase (methanol/ethanol family)
MGNRAQLRQQAEVRHGSSATIVMGTAGMHDDNRWAAMLAQTGKLFAIGFLVFLIFTSSAGSASVDADTSLAAGDWPMPGKDYANTRFSRLQEITSQNVRLLQVAFTFSTAAPRGQESAPIVVGDTLFVVGAYPNILYALDLSKPGAPLKWRYEPKPAAGAQGEACCDHVNRGPTASGGRVFFTTLDDQAVAVDAKDGKKIWQVSLGDYRKGETLTMAPLVVHDKVLVGNSGGEFGVRGWLAALDVRTGRQVWRAYSTGPDREVLIGDAYHPFYAMDQGSDLGVKSWPGDAWQQGGGTVWGWISYDSEENLIFYGTGNPSPWNETIRPGDNKFSNGIFARDPDSGSAHWFYQVAPHDLFDHDSVNELVLVNLAMGGRERKVAVRPDRNGLMYVIDRTTGEVLSADPFAPTNSNSGVDLKSGRLQYVEDKKPAVGKVIRNVCPSAPGAKDWNPSAYSPNTGWLYVPHNNLCMDWESRPTSYIAGTPYVGAQVKYFPASGGMGGEFMAWDIAHRRKAWALAEPWPVWSGAAVSAGGVVFYGTLDGWFKAVDAANGKLLWQFKTGSGIVGQPTIYRGPDGHEYVAILSGIGGWAGAVVSNDLDTRDATAANGWGEMMRNLKREATKGSMLYVFSLPH